MSKRERKRERTFEDVASVMEPGGEGFILDPIFRIKLGTTPILKNFKVRSYLNFMASLPMKRNPDTGYFEFAETPEEITALCKAYFFAAEPGALADSGYDQFRINKARHLLTQIIGNISADGLGLNKYIVTDTYGNIATFLNSTPIATVAVWNNEAVLANAESPALATNNARSISVGVTVDRAVDVIVEVALGIGGYREHTRLVFTAAGKKIQDIMIASNNTRFKVTADCTITAEILTKM